MDQPIADDTLAYYNQHARSFVADTVNADMGPLYQEFLPHLPSQGIILDLGCGSGRDTKAFRARGFRVIAVDPSEELAKLASDYCQIPVLRRRAQDLDFINAFDGIWANASLLHIPIIEIDHVINRLIMALKPGGTLFLSFKYGRGERWIDGRLFIFWDKWLLHHVMSDKPLTEVKVWQTSDVRPHKSQTWLNAVYRLQPR